MFRRDCDGPARWRGNVIKNPDEEEEQGAHDYALSVWGVAAYRAACIFSVESSFSICAA